MAASFERRVKGELVALLQRGARRAGGFASNIWPVTRGYTITARALGEKAPRTERTHTSSTPGEAQCADS
jgi:hypothetical protein